MRAITKRIQAVAFMWLCAVAVMAASLVFPGSALASDYTWKGGGAPAGNWSDTSNWTSGAPSGTVGTLSFPLLSGCPNPAIACYTSNNDLTGVTATGLSLDSGAQYSIAGQPITLGSGGIVASTSSLSAGPSLKLPIALDASQTWSITRGDIELYNTVTGTGASVAIDLTNAHLYLTPPSPDVEVGPIAITGSPSSNSGARAGQSGSVVLGNAQPLGSALSPLNLNGTDGNSVSISHALLFAPNAGQVGPLTATGADIQLGNTPSDNAGMLLVNGGVTLDPASRVSLYINQPGSAAGVDYSQIHASGNVNLAGVQLQLASQGCPDLAVGTVDTLVTTTAGTLSGTFAGIPNGAVVKLLCVGSQPLMRVNYTPNSATATVVSNPPSGGGAAESHKEAGGGGAPASQGSSALTAQEQLRLQQGFARWRAAAKDALKQNGIKYQFNAPIGGCLAASLAKTAGAEKKAAPSQAMSARKARGRSRSTVVFGATHRRFGAAGKATIFQRLTALGRRLLRSARRRHRAVRVSLTLSFTPTGGTTVSLAGLVRFTLSKRGRRGGQATATQVYFPVTGSPGGGLNKPPPPAATPTC